jgi:hypothetical protein
MLAASEESESIRAGLAGSAERDTRLAAFPGRGFRLPVG